MENFGTNLKKGAVASLKVLLKVMTFIVEATEDPHTRQMRKLNEKLDTINKTLSTK